MAGSVQNLANHVLDLYNGLEPSRRLLIAIAGVPGSGKTTIARKLVTAINTQDRAPKPPAVLVSMDGFHYPRAVLERMPNPDYMFQRRGAEFTFDALAFHNMVTLLREPAGANTRTIAVPSFDHALKDPVEGDVVVSLDMRLIILEGNYLALDKSPWRETASMMDEVWFVEVGLETVKRRLVKRHLEAGIETNAQSSLARVESNDFINAREIIAKRLPVDRVVSGEGDAPVAGGLSSQR